MTWNFDDMPSEPALLIGLDLGTTTIKAAAYDPGLGQLIAITTRPTPVLHPAQDQSEHAPEALWRAASGCLRDLSGRIAAHRAGGLAIASFAEAGLPLDDGMQPLYPIIAWYDRRSEPQAAWLESCIDPESLHAITGQRVSPSFGVTKWLWIREHRPEVAARTALWLSAPDYVLWRLCGAVATDYTIASRTLFFDQRALAWSPEMLALAGLKASQLPGPRPSGSVAGELTDVAAQATGLPAGLPCVVGGHDHLCAALAAGAWRPGSLVDSTGTAQAVLSVLPAFHTSAEAARGGFACYRHVAPDVYVLKAGMKLAGGAIEWLARLLFGSPAGTEALLYTTLEEEAEATTGKSAGPLWLPHLIGSGTPEGDRFSLAAAVGLRPEHTRGDLYRGLLESLAFWLRHNVEAMADLTGLPTEEVLLLGGVTRLRLLSQLKADCLGMPVYAPEIEQEAATGAALLAGLGARVFHDITAACGSVRAGRQVFLPDPTRVAHYNRLYRDVYSGLYEALRPAHHAINEMRQD
jgi:xylulokinase